MTHEESKIQQACVRWFRYQYPELTLFAIPNGGKRGKVEAGIMKAEGVLAGVADLFLMHANKDYHGLFLEAKTSKGKQSDSQIDFECAAYLENYDYAIFRSFEEFEKVVTDYLKHYDRQQRTRKG